MIQSTAYCSCGYYIGYFIIGSLHPLGIWLQDLCAMFYPQFQLIIVIPSVIKGRGVVRENMCSCADTWANIARCHSAPLGSTS